MVYKRFYMLIVGGLLLYPLSGISCQAKKTIKRICLSCDEHKNVRDFLALECGHSFCSSCLEVTVERAVANKNMLLLICPLCDDFWGINDLLTVATEEQLKEMTKMSGELPRSED